MTLARSADMTSTARGIGIRTLLLVIGVLLLFGWLAAMALKIAGALIHFVAVAAVVLIVGAFVAAKLR